MIDEVYVVSLLPDASKSYFIKLDYLSIKECYEVSTNDELSLFSSSD